MSLQALIDAARRKWTPEELAERLDAHRERLRKFDLELIERRRCGTCGADLVNYSHTFDCKWRGVCS